MLYLVQYDLNAQKDYDSLITEIKKSPGYAPLLKSTWGVETKETARALCERLRAKMDKDDFILVTQLKSGFDWWSWLPKDLNDWLVEAAKNA